jgi:type IX secretion system PorP/SprF family membrane protein
MSKLKSLILVCCLTAGLAQRSVAQDLHFSQYGETPFTINPALAAVAYDIRLITNYKNQWASVASPYKSFGFSGEFGLKYRKLNKSYLSTGLNVYRDMAGDAKMGTTHVDITIGGVVKAGKYSKLSAGIMGGITSKTMDYTKLKWESQYDGFMYDASLSSGETQTTTSYYYGDFAGGLNWHYSKSEQYISADHGTRFDIGGSVFHFNSPKQSYLKDNNEKQYMKYVGYANFFIGAKGSNVGFAPGIVYMMQGPSSEILASAMFKYIIQDQSVFTGLVKPCALSLGASYRYKDAFIPTMLFEYDKYALGVSYDVNLSTLTTASKSKGGLEIALRYNWNPGYGKMLGGSLTRPTYKNQ